MKLMNKTSLKMIEDERGNEHDGIWSEAWYNCLLLLRLIITLFLLTRLHGWRDIVFAAYIVCRIFAGYPVGMKSVGVA